MKKKYAVFIIFSISIFYSNCVIKNSDKEFENLEILGRYLFFDTRLSVNNTKSCASCHNPKFAFTDGYRTSATALGENVSHNSPSLINVKYLKRFDWANPKNTDLSQQIKRPLFSENPIELGLQLHFNKLKNEIKSDSLYNVLFHNAFPNDDSLFTLNQIEKALISYEKTLESNESDFDKNKLNDLAKYGYKLFSSKKLNCNNCHPPPYFTLAALTNNTDSIYANIGLNNFSKNNLQSIYDEGLFTFTKKEEDKGKFKIPSLRNVMLTAPYMHDGSVTSIEEVIEIYARGGRIYNNEDGRHNKNKHPLIHGFIITEIEKKALIAFLNSLTDSSIFYKQKFQNPFKNL